MSEIHNYSVEEVIELFTETVTETFAATDEGQKHLNRIAKAITNESQVKRTKNQRKTLAEIAFNKELAKVVAKTPAKVEDFVLGKSEWITKYIDRKYGNEE